MENRRLLVLGASVIAGMAATQKCKGATTMLDQQSAYDPIGWIDVGRGCTYLDDAGGQAGPQISQSGHRPGTQNERARKSSDRRHLARGKSE
jgi:hypothetical protein